MKRRNLIWLFCCFWFVACASEPVIEVAGPSAVQVMFASDDYYVGAPRIALVMFDGPDVADVATVDVTLLDISSPDSAEITWQAPAQTYTDYELPYWVTYPEIPSAGNWGLQIDLVAADGVTESYQRQIAVAAAPSSPAIGTQPPASRNRTSATHTLEQLSSANDPVPDLYTLQVADALDSGRPTVVSFNTPAFCQTKICAPVLDSIEAVYDEWGGQANVIHLEVYKDFQALTLADEMTEWALTSEPWTFVMDANGTVVARLGGPVAPSELNAALTLLIEE